ncbi:MAG TPA: hypothetical protein VHX65_05840 [Pirellulales bacterium]|jgi:hypothetical protein|nr:hypothetical protein [Pirellulales bacterium]
MATWRRLVLGLCAAACGWAVCVGAAHAQTDDAPTLRELDVWGRFAAGSWKQTHVVTEVLDSAGHVVSSTASDVRTTLTRVDGRRITLRVAVTLDAGGRRFDTAPQVIDRGYFGETTDQPAQVRDLGKASVVIDGREIPVQTREASIQSGKQKTVNKFFETGAMEPYLLRRETHFTDSADPAANHDETSEVIAVDKPYRVQSEVKPVSFERVVQKDTHGTTVTVDVTSVDVPGGIVKRTSKQLDADGHVTRRTTVELVDYGAVEEQAPDAGRRRYRRRRSRRIVLDHVDVTTDPIASPPPP